MEVVLNEDPFLQQGGTQRGEYSCLGRDDRISPQKIKKWGYHRKVNPLKVCFMSV